MNFNINIDDLRRMESLLGNNTNIDKLYTKLYTFELEDKKDSEEYKKHLEYLSIFLEFEEKTYKEANLTIDKALSWISFLYQKSDNKIISRILYNLFSRLTIKYNELQRLTLEEVQNIASLFSVKVFGTNKETICKCIILKDTIEKNLYYTFLNFLQKHIETINNNELRHNLIVGKYTTLFTNPKIEKIALKNNFDISPTPEIIEEIPIELLPLNDSLYRFVKDLISSTIAEGQIKELLKISDADYNDILITTASIYSQSMLRAAFQIMSDDKIDELNYNFNKYTKSEEYLKCHQNDHISYNLIIHNFKEINNDKKKRKIL